ncbi:MAG TPA: hypothetical protein VF815_05220 [Myxococcaceae bacterium]|jgi:hypothetical protein
MDSAIQQPAPSIVPRPVQANLYELRNRTVSVSFSATSITGDPLLHYKDRDREVNARGKEIRIAESEIGSLVSITLEPDADAGSLIFSVLIPRVVINARSGEHPVVTEAFYTRSRLPPRLPASVQLQTYEGVKLKGTAAFVVS